jgi:hypothetical protein
MGKLDLLNIGFDYLKNGIASIETEEDKKECIEALEKCQKVLNKVLKKII